MNLWRFLNKCINDRPAAVRSAKLIARSLYGSLYWFYCPGSPLAYNVPAGGTLLLQPGHSFTGCFWPGGVDYYEPDVRALLLHLLKPGRTFIDCGANIGYFSVQAGGLVGRDGNVIAIEANPVTYELLERNLKKNGFGIPIHCALSSRRGEVELFVPSDGDVYSSLRADGLVKNSVSYQSISVQSRTLDEVVESLGLKRVDVIKIDVEGAELEVLSSAANVLNRYRPVVIVEYSTNTWEAFGATAEGMRSLCRKHNYVIRQFNMKKRLFDRIEEDVWKSPYLNLVLVPEEVEFSNRN
jgi:FkbM family methyltransferase